MKILLLLALFAHEISALAQFRLPSATEPYTFREPISLTPKKTLITGLLSDPTGNYRTQSPLMINSSSFGYDWRAQNNFFWTGNITTMSYNKGKFGTYFYWDVQGNLRGTRGFIDISGKNKRGLKLVFQWRQLLKNKF